MMTPRAMFPACPALRSLPSETALFLAAVGVYFFSLPMQSDTSFIAALVTACALLVVKRQNLAPCFRAPFIRWGFSAFGFFLLAALAGSFLNPSTLYDYPRFLLWLMCLFSGVVFGCALPRASGLYLWATVAGLAVCALYAFAVYGYAAPPLWHHGRLKLFSIHPSLLSLYASIPFLFLLHTSVTGKKCKRLLAVAGCVFLLFLQVKAGTRGNLFVLPLGALCLVTSLPRIYWKRFAVLFLACCILAAGGVWMKKDTRGGKRILSALTNVTEDTTFKTRLPIWEAGWHAFTERPLLGHGPKSYRSLHTEYVKTREADLAERYEVYERSVKHAHNMVLGRLVDSGVFGTAGFLACYFAAVAAAWRGPARNRWLVAPLVFYFAVNMLDDGLFRVNDALIFFLAGNALSSGVSDVSSSA